MGLSRGADFDFKFSSIQTFTQSNHVHRDQQTVFQLKYLFRKEYLQLMQRMLDKRFL